MLFKALIFPFNYLLEKFLSRSVCCTFFSHLLEHSPFSTVKYYHRAYVYSAIIMNYPVAFLKFLFFRLVEC